MRGWSVHSLALDAANPRTLYAGTWSDGVWKTTDGGATWKKTFGEPRQAAVMGLAIDPRNAQNVYAAVDTGSNDGVHRSANGGTTWTRSTEGLPPNVRLYSLAIDPQTPSTLYAGTASNGVWKSIDGAKTWTATGAEIGERRVDALAVDPVSADTVYAGTDHGVAKSVDGGRTWQVATTAPMKDRRVRSLAIDRTRPERVWAGLPNLLMRSDDAGRTWRAMTSGVEWMSFTALVLDPVNPDGLTAGTSRDGVLTTRDGGRTWSAPSASFLATDVTSIAVDPAAPQEIWAGTKPTGVYRSPDGGATWSQASEGLTDRAVYQVILDPGRALWAGTGNGAFKSTDAGAHWTRASNGITASEDIVNLAIDPANPRRRFAQARFLNFYRSEDGGANWIDVKAKFESQNLNGLFGLAIVPGSPERIFVGIDRWLWQSIDGGATFAKCCGTLPLTRIQALAFDRGDEHAVRGHRARRRVEERRRWRDMGREQQRARQGERAGAHRRRQRHALRRDVPAGRLPQHESWRDLDTCRRRAAASGRDHAGARSVGAGKAPRRHERRRRVEIGDRRHTVGHVAAVRVAVVGITSLFRPPIVPCDHARP